MHKLITRILLLSALLFSVSAFSTEPPVLKLSKSFDKVNIGGNYSWYEDKTAQLDLNDILSPKYSDRFVVGQKESLSFGYTSSSIWLQIKIKNLRNDKQNWLLNFDYPLLDKIEVFSKVNGNDWNKEVMGDLLPFNERPISHRTFVTPLPFNIRQNIRKLEIKHKQESGLGNVTVSIGIATIVPAIDQQPMTIFRNADKTLFKAKQQGRNSAASFEVGE